MNDQIPDYQYCPFCGRQLIFRTTPEKERLYCTACDWTYYPHIATSVGAIIQKDNQVLLVKRDIEPFKGYWQLPAGFIEYGEHPHTALEREVEEETGLQVKDIEFFQLFQVNDDPREPGHLFLSFKTKVSSGSISTDENENSDIAWHSLDDLPPIGWHSHQAILKSLIS